MKCPAPPSLEALAYNAIGPEEELAQIPEVVEDDVKRKARRMISRAYTKSASQQELQHSRTSQIQPPVGR